MRRLYLLTIGLLLWAVSAEAQISTVGTEKLPNNCAGGSIPVKNGTTLEWDCSTTTGIGLPAVDTTAILSDNGTPANTLRFELGGFSAPRVLTPPNFDGTIATLGGTETFGGLKTFTLGAVFGPYTVETLPAAGTPGRLAYVTDKCRLVYADQGTQWLPTSAECNAAAFGAKADGPTTDNTAAIQAAIDAAESLMDATLSESLSTVTVLVPGAANYYKTTAALAITKSFVRLVGGAGGTTIRNATSGADVIAINAGAPATSLKGVVVERLTLKGTGATSRAVYANYTEHLTIRDINTMGHPGPSVYLESTNVNLQGASFTVVDHVYAQPSAAVTCFTDKRGITNHFKYIRARECEIGILFDDTIDAEVSGSYLESMNRGTEQTAIKAIVSGTQDLTSKRILTVKNDYFENNIRYAINASNGFILICDGCTTAGGATVGTKVAHDVIRADGGGSIRGLHGGGLTLLRSDGGVLSVDSSVNFYGRASQLSVEGMRAPFGPPYQNQIPNSWLDTAPSAWATAGTNAPVVAHDATGSNGFLGRNAYKVTFPSGGGGTAFSRVFLSSLNLTTTAVNQDYSVLMAIKADTANELVGVRLSVPGDAVVTTFVTDTNWQLVSFQASTNTSASTASVNMYPVTGAEYAAPVNLWFGGLAATLDAPIGLANTSTITTAPAVGDTNFANVLASGTIRGLVTTARTTMSGNATLTVTSARVQGFDPNGSNRDVTLPATTTGLLFAVRHIGSANTVTVKDAAAATVTTLSAGDSATVYYDGTAWVVL